MKLCYSATASLLVLFVSCDCFVHEAGVVLDSSTNEPLPGVTIRFDTKTYRTDDNGHYSIESVTGFCPDRHFIFEMEGYKPMEMRIETDGDEISYSVIARQEFINYDSPKYLDSTKRSFIIGEWVTLTSKNFSVMNDTLTIYLDK